jgi:hypothetical protein
MQAPGWFGGTFGTRTMTPSADLDEDTLTEVAALTGGRYFRARNRGELQSIYATLDRLEPVAAPDEVFRPVKQLFHWPLALALILSLLLALLQSGRLALPRNPRSPRNPGDDTGTGGSEREAGSRSGGWPRRTPLRAGHAPEVRP